MDYAPTPDWFYEPFVETHLPLIRINTFDQTIVDEPRIIANMQIVDNGPGQSNFLDDPATDYDGQIAIEIRGTSSQGYDKKNYGFETQDQNGNNNNITYRCISSICPTKDFDALHFLYTTVVCNI